MVSWYHGLTLGVVKIRARAILNFLNETFPFSLHILVAYFESFPKYNKIFFH